MHDFPERSSSNDQGFAYGHYQIQTRRFDQKTHHELLEALTKVLPVLPIYRALRDIVEREVCKLHRPRQQGRSSF